MKYNYTFLLSSVVWAQKWTFQKLIRNSIICTFPVVKAWGMLTHYTDKHHYALHLRITWMICFNFKKPNLPVLLMLFYPIKIFLQFPLTEFRARLRVRGGIQTEGGTHWLSLRVLKVNDVQWELVEITRLETLLSFTAQGWGCLITHAMRFKKPFRFVKWIFIPFQNPPAHSLQPLEDYRVSRFVLHL